MAKILYISPIGTDGVNDHILKSLKDETKPGNEVDVISFDPIDNNWRSVSLQLGNCVKATIDAEKTGYGAVILGCVADPGFSRMQRAVNIPVVAPGSAALHVAATLGKYTAITPSRGSRIRDLARRYGLDHKIASIQSANCGPPEGPDYPYDVKNARKHIQTELDSFQKAMKDTVPGLIKKAVTEEGAKVIIFGCTFFSGWKKERNAIEKEYKVPLYEPNLISLKVAEMHIENKAR